MFRGRIIYNDDLCTKDEILDHLRENNLHQMAGYAYLELSEEDIIILRLKFPGVEFDVFSEDITLQKYSVNS